MTGKELLEKLQNMSEEELNCTVFIPYGSRSVFKQSHTCGVVNNLRSYGYINKGLPPELALTVSLPTNKIPSDGVNRLIIL